jgi:hypothetical protein
LFVITYKALYLDYSDQDMKGDGLIRPYPISLLLSSPFSHLSNFQVGTSMCLEAYIPQILLKVWHALGLDIY